MFERVESFTSTKRNALGLLALAGLGTYIYKKFGRSGSFPEGRMVKGIPFTETQLERGGNALLPFVSEWSLGLNGENLDLMAYAVLKHASSTRRLDSPEDYHQIEDDVRGMISSDRLAQERMEEVWQRDIDSRA